MSDVLDILDLSEAKAALAVSETDSSKDQSLAVYITAVSRMIDAEFGPVVARTITNELAPIFEGVARTRWSPVLSFGTVTEYWRGAGIALTEEIPTSSTLGNASFLPERYSLDPSLFSGVVRRRANGLDYWFSLATVMNITYSAGRFVDTESVDARWKRAAEIALENLWRDQQLSVGNVDQYDVPNQSFPGFALPNAVKELLGQERQYLFGIA